MTKLEKILRKFEDEIASQDDDTTQEIPDFVNKTVINTLINHFRNKGYQVLNTDFTISKLEDQFIITGRVAGKSIILTSTDNKVVSIKTDNDELSKELNELFVIDSSEEDYRNRLVWHPGKMMADLSFNGKSLKKGASVLFYVLKDVLVFKDLMEVPIKLQGDSLSKFVK